MLRLLMKDYIQRRTVPTTANPCEKRYNKCVWTLLIAEELPLEDKSKHIVVVMNDGFIVRYVHILHSAP